MKSTLLFVAVLLACAPVHGQSTGPVEAPVLHFWLASVLARPMVETAGAMVVRRQRAALKTVVAYPPIESEVDETKVLPVVGASGACLLLHSPNAP